MGSWNSDLHRRQQKGDVPSQHSALVGALGGDIGYDAPAPSGRRRWRPLLVPALGLLLGFVLAMFSPVPGLGVIVVIGSVSAVAAIGLKSFLGG